MRAAVSGFTVPTDGPESDGTLEWTSTTIVIVEADAGGVSGIGYTYGHKATAALISDMLLPIVRDRVAMDVAGAWMTMTRAIRNQGRPSRGKRSHCHHLRCELTLNQRGSCVFTRHFSP
jgi:hypothetical protein